MHYMYLMSSLNSIYYSSQSPFLFIKPHQWTYPNPNLSKYHTNISCTTRRRKPSRNFNNNKPSQFSDENVEMMIDIELIKTRAFSTFKSVSRSVQSGAEQFVVSGKDAYRDLQTLISFDNNGRLFVSCRRSTLLFMGDLVIWSFLVFFGVRFLVKIGAGIKNQFGFRTESVVVRRDRSLGGKQVVVGTQSRVNENVKAVSNPLMSYWESGANGLESGLKNQVRTSNKLPGWWPVLLPEPTSTTMMDREENQRNANRLIRAITDNRMGGQDIFKGEIVLLRRICRTSGVRVNIETRNVRDSIYRTSVDFVLDTCSSSPSETTSVQIDGEDARQFLAGLADNIGLENILAARMVSAGVAARTRSYILQSWAFEMQGKHSEAMMEVSKTCRIHRIFPPEESSPEMEMVARGLEKHLKLEQREFLMNMLRGVCSEDTQRSISEALGLVFSSKPAIDQQEKLT